MSTLYSLRCTSGPSSELLLPSTKLAEGRCTQICWDDEQAAALVSPPTSSLLKGCRSADLMFLRSKGDCCYFSFVAAVAAETELIWRRVISSSRPKESSLEKLLALGESPALAVVPVSELLGVKPLAAPYVGVASTPAALKPG